MNVFAESPDVIHASPADRNPDLTLGGNYRMMYHKGFGMDDADRYGPMIEAVKDLHRRIEEADIAARERAGSRLVEVP
jgi:5,5'-dehydrodivanillate O-demethylase